MDLANSSSHPLACEYVCERVNERPCKALWDTVKVLKKRYISTVNYHLIKWDKFSNCTAEITWRYWETNKLSITYLCVCHFLPGLWAYLPESTNTRKSPRRCAIHRLWIVFFVFFFSISSSFVLHYPNSVMTTFVKEIQTPICIAVYLAAWQFEELPALFECLERQRCSAKKQNTSRVQNRAGVNDNGNDSD